MTDSKVWKWISGEAKLLNRFGDHDTRRILANPGMVQAFQEGLIWSLAESHTKTWNLFKKLYALDDAQWVSGGSPI